MSLHNKNFSGVILFSCIIAYMMSGCTAMKTFPEAAKAGETVALAVGSADGMNRSNTTAVYVSDSEPGSVDLTAGIRGIFKLYADKASSVYDASSNTKQIVQTSLHEPWINIMVIDLPATDLPVGTGNVQISTTATYPTIGSHINDYPVALEILPGLGSPSNLDYEFGVGSIQTGDLSLLEALPHAQVVPTNPLDTAWPTYGAIELKLDVLTDQHRALDPPFLRVLVDDMSVNTSSGLSSSYRHNDNEQLTVMLTSVTGRLEYYEARFSVVLLNSNTFAVNFLGTPVVESARYFDIDGNEVDGPQALDYLVQLN